MLRAVLFDRLWPLALLNTVAEYLFVPLPPLLLVSLWQRRRSALMALSVPSVAFIFLFGELLWPPLAAPSDDTHAPRITVMSFNVLHSNQAYDAIARSVRAAAPDVVGFQELTPTSARAIADALTADYPYGTLQSLEPGRSAGLLSRFPITTAEWMPLPPLDITLHAMIEVQGKPVHIFVVHLSANNFFDYPLAESLALIHERYQRRADEVARLQDVIADLTEPVLLMCDCNLTDTSEAYSHLRVFLHDSFREAGWGWGHTFQPAHVPMPLQRLDYVWHSDEFVAVQAYVGEGAGSDHRPVVATLKMSQPLGVANE
jgi:endonuclease/exonuclease/phosphatase (EEP) superfamily protein YafD